MSADDAIEAALLAVDLSGVQLDDADRTWMAAAVEEQHKVSAQIHRLVLDEVDPIVQFDPRWDD
jgi:nitrate reductase beta subunit